jgi:hypothetical protein
MVMGAFAAKRGEPQCKTRKISVESKIYKYWFLTKSPKYIIRRMIANAIIRPNINRGGEKSKDISLPVEKERFLYFKLLSQ